MLSQNELDEFLGKLNKRETTINKVKYPELQVQTALPQAKLPMDFFNDITVNILAELGQATLTVKEVLNLKEDMVIELEKAAGETVNLKVNGQSFARGEVIIIGNNLGIRVDRINDPSYSNGAHQTKDLKNG